MKWDPEPVDAAVKQVIESSKLPWPHQETLYAAWDTYRDRFECEPSVVSDSATVLLKFLRANEGEDDTFRAAIEALERWVIVPKDILISARESTASARLLDWAGLTEIWSKHHLSLAASPLEIAAKCLSVHIGRRLIENASGQGVWFVTVIAHRPEQFRAELRSATAKLLRRLRKRGAASGGKSDDEEDRTESAVP
jgi:hypothetical protein